MSKSTKTKVESSKIIARLSAVEGLSQEEQAGYIKVKATNGRRLYVAKNKGGVTKVDLSWVEMAPGNPGIVYLGGLSYGGVKQQVQFEGRTEEEILQTIEDVARFMVTLPAMAKEKKARPEAAAAKPPKAKKASADAGTAPAADAKETKRTGDGGLSSRRALIEKVARLKGVKVSEKTKAEIAAEEATKPVEPVTPPMIVEEQQAEQPADPIVQALAEATNVPAPEAQQSA